jgi:hypothetical protein
MKPKAMSKRRSLHRAREMAIMARGLEQPPKIRVSATFPMIFRFQCAGAQTASAYNRGQLLSLLVSGNGSTSATRLIQSIKVNKLELWDPANGVNVTNHANITWLSTQSQRSVIDAVTVGTAAAAYISTRPPRNSTAFFVSSQGVNESEGLFGITCSVGAILDVHATVTIASDWTVVMSVVTTANTTTAGQVYFWNLDGASGNMKPTVELSRIT